MGSGAARIRTGAHMGSQAFKARTLAARPRCRALSFYLCSHPIKVPLKVQTIPFLIQLPANVPREAVEDSLRPCKRSLEHSFQPSPLCPCGRPQETLQAPGFGSSQVLAIGATREESQWMTNLFLGLSFSV